MKTTIGEAMDAYEDGRLAWKRGEAATPPDAVVETVCAAFWAWGWLDAQQHFNSKFPKGDAKRRIETVNDQL